jgi:serine/threonine-protein kinase
MPPITEKKILNRYVIRHEIAKFSQGVVYRAQDRLLKDEVALKVIDPGLSAPEMLFDALLEEVTPLLPLKHDNIVPYIDFQRYHDDCVLVTKFIEGPTLKDTLADYPDGFPVSEVIRIVGALAEAIDYLHAQRLIHQDVTPTNVILRLSDRRPFLIDHYLKALEEREEAPPNAAYMSPEQSANTPLDYTTDNYALAIMTFEMLTGQRPYRGISPGVPDSGSLIQKIQWEHQFAPIPQISDIRDDMPIALNSVFAKALAKTPDMRYENALDFFYDLKNALVNSRVDLSESALTLKAPQYYEGPRRPSRLGCLLQLLLAGALIAGLAYLANTFLPPLVAPVLEQVTMPTNTPRITVTPSVTLTNTNAPSATPTLTLTPSATMTQTSTPTRFPTSTQRPTDPPPPSATPPVILTPPTNTPTRFPTSTQRPTATPFATRTPTAEFTAVSLGEDPINVRAAPTLDGAVVSILRPNIGVTVIARDITGQWLRLRLPNIPSAWVRASLLNLTSAQIELLPISS